MHDVSFFVGVVTGTLATLVALWGRIELSVRRASSPVEPCSHCGDALGSPYYLLRVNSDEYLVCSSCHDTHSAAQLAESIRRPPRGDHVFH